MSLCAFVVATLRTWSVAKARHVATRLVCGAPAKRCGGKAYCAIHWPSVVACVGAALLLSLGGGR